MLLVFVFYFQDVFAFEVLIVSILNLADSAAKQGFHFGYLGPL